ncbi:MAG: transglutaminaseTgpA domain-containing protein [Ilumatobacter sp.]
MELTSLLRVRVILAATMFASLALTAGDVFDRRIWWLLVPPIAVGVAAAVTVTRRWPWRLLALAATMVAPTALVVVAVGGDAADIVSSFTSGPRRILSTDWPSPYRSELVGVVALVLGALTATATELARQRRFHLAPLVPVSIGAILVIAMSAPTGTQLLRFAPVAALAILLAALRPGDGTGLRERITLLRGERRLVVVAGLVVFAVAAATIPVAFEGRDDPRRNDPAERAVPVLDPIEATLALQAIEPAMDLHDIEITARGADVGSLRPLRWRTAALSAYDGRRWSPELTLRPIGQRLGPAAGDTITASMRFLDANSQLVPIPGDPVMVTAAVETDPERTIVRLEERPDPDTPIDVEARLAPTLSGADPGLVGTRPVSDRAGGFTDLAEALAEEGGSEPGDDTLARLVAIESVLREDYVLRSDASGGGLQQSLIDRFLRDTQRGNSEQFSTSFTLLARSLGVDARIATGFQIDDARASADSFTITSADARTWPEVRIEDRWIAFDPVPESEASDATAEEPEPQQQTPAAPQPPTPPPPETAEDPEVVDDNQNNADADGLPTVARYALVTGAVVGLASIPVLLVVLLILGIKWRRRRRLLHGAPGERIRGAWKVATSRLIDGGLTIGQATTNDEIAAVGAESIPEAQRELNRLARLSNAATFGQPIREDLLAEDAATCLDHVEASMAEQRSWYERLRWRLSLRSLRRSTASPV